MTFHSITTLKEIRAARPCEDGWKKLLAGLGKKRADDDPLPLADVLRINGFDDATWVLRVPSLERLSRHFQAACAERVLHLFENKRPDDMRVREQIAMLRNDTATPEERAAAWAAARSTEWDTAWKTAWNAARDAASAAARAAAWDAARAAERAAAPDAAWKTAWNAAMTAAWAAARAAGRDAGRDAWHDERAAQERILRNMIGVA